jgi:cation diffusion facilitator CzcD-associated flavoprotein CzcO
LVDDPIVNVSEKGILEKSGLERKADVITCATGFNATFELKIPILGLGGYALSENWGKDKKTESYMSCSVARFQNFFGKQSHPERPLPSKAFADTQL